MKFARIPLLGAAAIAMTLHAAGTDLESVQTAKWVHKDYTNADYGISVSVSKRSQAESKRHSARGGVFKVIEEEGRKVSVSIQEDDKQTVTVRVPLDLKTTSYLLTAGDEPDYVRFIAASHIAEAAIGDDEKIRLFRQGIRLKEASLRFYVWKSIREFKPRAEVSGMFHLALLDPCLDIAGDGLSYIIAEYGLRSKDGSEIKLMQVYAGSTRGFYDAQYRQVLEVAESLRRKKPDLISESDLNLIRSRSKPSDQWLEFYEIKE